jgi:hypothetical protein
MPVKVTTSDTEFTLLRFNPRRFQRGVEAAQVRCVGDGIDADLWMSRKDIELNIKEHGPHPELLRAQEAYKRPGVEIGR